MGEFKQARRPAKLPVVLTQEEVRQLLCELEPPYRLCCQLMYGSGLRRMEVCRLRVKDIDLRRLSITVREGKGGKQCITTLSEACVEALKHQLSVVEMYWHDDRGAKEWGGVYMPFALERKYPSAPFDLAWQYVFPARTRTHDKRYGKVRRHHIYEQGLQRAVKRAVRRTNVQKPAPYCCDQPTPAVVRRQDAVVTGESALTRRAPRNLPCSAPRSRGR